MSDTQTGRSEAVTAAVVKIKARIGIGVGMMSEAEQRGLGQAGARAPATTTLGPNPTGPTTLVPDMSPRVQEAETRTETENGKEKKREKEKRREIGTEIESEGETGARTGAKIAAGEATAAVQKGKKVARTTRTAGSSAALRKSRKANANHRHLRELQIRNTSLASGSWMSKAT